MSKVAVISGSTGQDATFLIPLLLSKGYIVVAIKRRTSNPNNQRLGWIKHQNLFVANGDLTDANSINRIISEYQPDEFYHLGAMSYVPFSSNAPTLTTEVNCVGTVNVLEALKDLKRDCKFIMSASSEMFGDQLSCVDGRIILDENSTLMPRSPYGATKVFGYHMTRYYREAYDMFATNSIMFNHESFCRSEHFVTRKITQGIAAIKRGDTDCIYLGNIDAKRDWSHSYDMMRGLYMALQHNKPDDFVFASGHTWSVRDFLSMALRFADLDWFDGEDKCSDSDLIDKYVKIDEKFFRPAEINVLLGDPSKAKQVLGWQPTISFSELVESMVKYDLATDDIEKRKYINDELWR